MYKPIWPDNRNSISRIDEKTDVYAYDVYNQVCSWREILESCIVQTYDVPTF